MATKTAPDPRRTTTIEWRSTACPKCGAEPEERCRAGSGRGTDPHTVRLKAAEQGIRVRPLRPTGLTATGCDELDRRLERAYLSLEALRNTTTDLMEFERLRGKADGLRIAQSYLREHRS